MIIVKDERAIQGMRESCHLAARVREAVAQRVSPGVSTGELSEYAGSLIKEFGAESAFLGYRGYPGNICVSVNEVVVHGIPGDRRIEIGDIVSLDVGVKYNGFVGDTAKTIMVGVVDPGIVNLVSVAEHALRAGIGAAVEGNRVSDISHAIESFVVKGGCTVVRDFVGHGIGRKMHEDPQIPNFGSPGKGPVLRSGMTLAIEPMVNQGTCKVDVLDDGWTVVTRDRKPSAHFEHTILVKKGKAEILTV